MAPAPVCAAVGGAGAAFCNVTATPLMFGAYVPFAGAPADVNATITLTCTAPGTALVPVSGSIGLSSPGGPAGRFLADGAHHMRYQLYLDPARTIPWGDGTAYGCTAAIGAAATISGAAAGDASVSVWAATLTGAAPTGRKRSRRRLL